MNRFFLFFACISSFFFFSCSSDECGYIPEGEMPKVDISIERLEDEIFALDTPEKVKTFTERHPVIRDFFFRIEEYPSEDIFARDLSARFKNPHIDSLKMEVQKHFEDISWLEEGFERAFSYMKHYYPEVKIPKIQTVATGFDYDMVVSDSLIIIGLDYYMGKEAKYRPTHTYEYVRKRYDKEFIIPSVMLLYGISGNFNQVDSDDYTVLADMMSYGKSFYFAKRMLPCTPDSTLIWYSDVEMANVKANDYLVWAHFLENDILFNTGQQVKRKYIDERPQTYEIVQFKCPPRLGTWLGWEIVKQYMQRNPDLSLNELMNISDARTIFEGARYKPKRG